MVEVTRSQVVFAGATSLVFVAVWMAFAWAGFYVRGAGPLAALALPAALASAFVFAYVRARPG